MTGWNKYHAEFDFESACFPSELVGNLVRIPSDAVITEIKPPIKVGDVLDSVKLLDQVPTYSVILDSDGDAWQQQDVGLWCLASRIEREPDSSYDLITSYGPVTVIHIPEESE